MGIAEVMQSGFRRGIVIPFHLTSFFDPIKPTEPIRKATSSLEYIAGEVLSDMEYIIKHPKSLFTNKNLFRIRPMYGGGEMGSAMLEWIDYTVDVGIAAWQINPFGHTGYGNSPYQTFSRYAGTPYTLSIERLFQAGDLSLEEHNLFVRKVRQSGISPDNVDYGWFFTNKLGSSWSDDAILRTAYHNFKIKRNHTDNERYHNFCERNARWLNDYAEYMGIKELHGHKAWIEWAPEYKDTNIWKTRKEELLKKNIVLEKTIDYYKYLQFRWFEQWGTVKGYAHEYGRKIVGDMPWYVGFDSADVWAHRERFKLNKETFEPECVAGVPPDYFSPTGQLWGNPIPDWENPETFDWCADTIGFQLENVDIVRWDHSRADDTHWEIPYEHAVKEKTAVVGKWVKGPGTKLIDHVQSRLIEKGIIEEGGQLPFIFEDLGFLDTVYESPDKYPPGIPRDCRYRVPKDFAQMIRDKDKLLIDGLTVDGGYSPRDALDMIMHRYEIPWMGVAQFGVDGDKRLKTVNWPYNCVGFTGTHDNDTTLGYWKARKIKDNLDIDPLKEAHNTLVATLSSQAALAGMPWQDMQLSDSDMRFNLPGNMRPGGWWTARMTQGYFRKLLYNAPQFKFENINLYDRYVGLPG